MTPSQTPPDTAASYVLRRAALRDVQTVESRSAPDLADELLELREALEKEIAERDHEVAERGKRPAEVGAGVSGMVLRIGSAMRTAFGHSRMSKGMP